MLWATARNAAFQNLTMAKNQKSLAKVTVTPFSLILFAVARISGNTKSSFWGSLRCEYGRRNFYLPPVASPVNTRDLREILVFWEVHTPWSGTTGYSRKDAGGYLGSLGAQSHSAPERMSRIYLHCL